jgi:hypothetical protein
VAAAGARPRFGTSPWRQSRREKTGVSFTPMTIKIFVGYPPDRDSPQAEFRISHDGLVDIPALLYREDGKLMIEIFSQAGGEPEWTLPLADFVQAIGNGMAALGM